MKQEDKELLLKDLCARVPYGVKILYNNEVFGIEYVSPMYEEVKLDTSENWTVGVSDIKPYLFPISSMTEEQKKEYDSLRDSASTCHYECGDIVEDMELYDNWKSIDYLITHHFDYRGLIEKGLVIDATGLNIY